ncbi:MAG: Cof-type HAD-IIB family hydrolase [Firmicutes bacterium]|nr:Cof-type HAD-IIB family hydrolase [Bacillota bacterium]
MTNEKVIFVDFDGTLAKKDKSVSQRNIDAINLAKQNGWEVVLCTGRGVDNVMHITKLTDIRYVIGCTGSVIYDIVEEKIVYQQIMDKAIVTRLYDILKDTDGFIDFATPKQKFATNDRIRQVDSLTRNIKTIQKDIYEFINENDIIQTTYFSRDLEIARQSYDMVKDVREMDIVGYAKELFESNPKPRGHYAIDMTAPGVSKGNGVREFCKLFNINLRDTICFGDEFNDVSMFKTVGIPVAMGNATNELKAIAKHVTDTHENDGVAVFIEKFFN